MFSGCTLRDAKQVPFVLDGNQNCASSDKHHEIPGFDFGNRRVRTLTLLWWQKHLQITFSALGIDTLFEVHYVLFSQIKELLAPFLLLKVGQQQLFSSERLMQLLFQQRCPYEGTLPCKLQYT